MTLPSRMVQAKATAAGEQARAAPIRASMGSRKVQREHSPSVAMRHKVFLSNLWKFARGFAEFKRNGKTNPTADAGSIYAVEQEHEPWPDAGQDRFLAACDANLYLDFHLLLWVIARRAGSRACYRL